MRESERLVPVLACGLAGGLLGSLSCCCWLGPAAAGFVGARLSGNAADGVGVGLISGAVVSTAGTALFLATAGVHEGADAISQAGLNLDAGGLAAAFALIGFGVSLAGAGLGGLLAGNRPPPRVRPAPVAVPPEALGVPPLEPATESPTEPPAEPRAVVEPPPQAEATAPEPRSAPQGDADSSLDVDSEELASADEERDAWD